MPETNLSTAPTAPVSFFGPTLVESLYCPRGSTMTNQHQHQHHQHQHNLSTPPSGGAAPTVSVGPPLEKLLQRYARQFIIVSSAGGGSNNNSNSNPGGGSSRPPDGAAAALGRALARQLLTQLAAAASSTSSSSSSPLTQAVWQRLCAIDSSSSSSLPSSSSCTAASIPHAFFQEITRSLLEPSEQPPFAATLSPELLEWGTRAESEASTAALLSRWFDWIPTWLLQTETAWIARRDSSHRSTPSSPSLNQRYHQYHHHQQQQHLQTILQACIPACAAYFVRVACQTAATLPHQRSLARGNKQPPPATWLSHRAVMVVGETYRRLQLESTQMELMRAILSVALVASPRNNRNQYSCNIVAVTADVLVPLLAYHLLTVTTTSEDTSQSRMHHNHGTLQKMALLSMLWQALWKSWTNLSKTEARLLLEMLQNLLLLFLDRCQGATSNKHSSSFWDWQALTESWLMEMASLAEALQQQYPDDINLLDQWFQTMMTGILPRLCADASSLAQGSLSLSSSTIALLQSHQRVLHARGTAQFLLSTTGAWSMVLWTLTTSPPADRIALLECLAQGAVPHSATATHLFTALATMMAHEPDAHAAVTMWQRRLKAVASEPICLAPAVAATPSFHPYQLLDLLERPADQRTLIDTLAESVNFGRTGTVPLSSAQQMGALLFGIILWKEQHEHGLRFLSNLLEHYPHLGIALLPIVMDRINDASFSGNGKALLQSLDFLCGPIVRDPHCAQEIWSLVGVKMLHPNVPLPVRVMMIRMFPQLCASNKRLYRRVMDAIGACMNNTREPQVRLVLAATMADLCQANHVQDVSDVIGWLQKLIMEEQRTSTTGNSSTAPVQDLTVHYAIMALHYLVMSGDLVFDVVIKVLNKRLCPVSDMKAVMKLPSVVLEALVLLLGDGECEGDSSSSGEEETDGEKPAPKIKVVSAQVSMAVRCLLHLGDAIDWTGKVAKADKSLPRVRRNICYSLSRYSLDALGLNEIGVKSVIALAQHPDAAPALSSAGQRYVAIRNVTVAALKSKVELPKENDEGSDPIIELARKVVAFEEDALGSTLWPGKMPKKRQLTPNEQALELLPGSGRVSELVGRRTSPGAAIASLLSLDGTQLSTLRDRADASLESSDPLFILFAVQGYLQAAARIVAKNDNISKMLTEVGSWFEVFVSPDTMYLIFASLSLYIPFDLREEKTSKTTFVEELCGAVVDAYKSQRFQKEDISKICLGIVAVSSLRFGKRKLKYVTEIVTMLEQSVRGYGGQQTFGAFYGLALISQGLERFINSDALLPVIEDAKKLVFRICAFLVEELLPCFEDREDIFKDLLSCLKSGLATADLVDSMSELEANSIALLMTKQVTARYLFISCALCLPTLATLSSPLLLASLRMMEAFEWGGGKGIALPPMLRACRVAKLFKSEELKEIYTEFAVTFEQRMDGEVADIDSEGLEDLFYAFNGTSAASTSHIIRRTIVGNRDLFDDDGALLSLIAMSIAIVPIPCLGGAFFSVPPELVTTATVADTKSIVGIAKDAAMSEKYSTYSDMATILLGIFASAKTPHDPEIISRSLPSPIDSGVESASMSTAPPTVEARNEAAIQLPNPQIETVLWSVVDIIEPSDESQAITHEHILLRAIAVLECLSLPGPFSKAFIEPLMKMKSPTILDGLLKLLSSQLRGRRRAVYDGSDFSRSAMHLLQLPLAEWRELNKGSALRDFVRSLAEITAKLPSDKIENALAHCWQNCVTTGSRELLSDFLLTMRQLLGSNAFSPKTTKAVRNVFLIKVTKSIFKTPLHVLIAKVADGKSPTLLELYAQCLQELPHAMLEEHVFRRAHKPFDNSEYDLVKMICLSILIDSGFIDTSTGRQKDLSLIWTWISKQLHSTKGLAKHGLHRILCFFARNTAEESAEFQRDKFTNLLELLLVTGSDGTRLGLQLLASMLAFWSEGDDTGSEPTLGFLCTLPSECCKWSDVDVFEDFYAVLENDLPFHLAAFARKENISAATWNVLHRLHLRWEEDPKLKVDDRLKTCVRKALLICQCNTTQEEALISQATSQLSSQVHAIGDPSYSLEDI